HARRMDQGPAALHSGKHDDVSGHEGRAPARRPARLSQGRHTQPGRAPKTAQGGNQVGGMMMGGGAVPNLKTLDPQERVRSINHCGDTYKVTTADGKTRDFWERNLRFKTDVSGEGPQKGAPALVGAGMIGDRADVIFAGPEEISGFISRQC